MADKDQCVKTAPLSSASREPWVLAGDMVGQLRVSCTGNPLRGSGHRGFKLDEGSGHRGSKLDEGFWAQGV